MSAISESVSQRLTLQMLVDRYGFALQPSFAGDVTITALANDVASVTPGTLFIPNHRIDMGRLSLAIQRGAYAVMLPTSMRADISECDVPILFADPTREQLGQLASLIAGNPAESLAVFAIAGSDSTQIGKDVAMLAQFLHMLGNPVGVVCAKDDNDLDQFVQLEYPVDVFAMQRVLSVCVEDGASAIILALDEETLTAGALESVSVDVLGFDSDTHDTSAMSAIIDDTQLRYGYQLREDAAIAIRTDETDTMAVQADFGPDCARPLSLAISCVLAAGVRKANIRSALRVSKELH